MNNIILIQCLNCHFILSSKVPIFKTNELIFFSNKIPFLEKKNEIFFSNQGIDQFCAFENIYCLCCKIHIGKNYITLNNFLNKLEIEICLYEKTLEYTNVSKYDDENEKMEIEIKFEKKNKNQEFNGNIIFKETNFVEIYNKIIDSHLRLRENEIIGISLNLKRLKTKFYEILNQKSKFL